MHTVTKEWFNNLDYILYPVYFKEKFSVNTPQIL